MIRLALDVFEASCLMMFLAGVAILAHAVGGVST